MEQDNTYRLVIVTGMSGGGKTQACRHLEDLGFFCVDNLPPVFIPKFAELCAHSAGHIARVVLVVDTRSREFFDTFLHVLEDMDRAGQKYELLFMDATDEAIIRRYKETRRRHPSPQRPAFRRHPAGAGAAGPRAGKGYLYHRYLGTAQS